MDWKNDLDMRSYRIGMAKAFCECVAADCKRCALSDPVREWEREALEGVMVQIAREHGLQAYFDASQDIPQDDRQCWWVFFKREEAIAEYRRLREAGHYPARDLMPFRAVLSYGTAWK